MASDFGFKATEKEHYYFVSYNTEDSQRIAPICNLLHNNGMQIWYDEGIPHNTYWESVLAEKIDKCEEAIFFITKNIFEKGKCRSLNEIYTYKEYDLARRYKKKRLIILLDKITDDDVPYSLMSWWQEIDPRLIQGIVSYQEPPIAIAEKVLREIGRNVNHSSLNEGEESNNTNLKGSTSGLKRIDDNTRILESGEIETEKSRSLSKSPAERMREKYQTFLLQNNSRFKNIRYLDSSSATVFSAFDTKMNMEVVVKFYPTYEAFRVPMFSDGDLFWDLKNLNASNISKVLERNLNEPVFIVMQYIEGETLEECINTWRLWIGSFEQALKVLIDILEGLKTIHEKNIYYGDLSPRNIIIDRNNKAWLCDFSVSDYNGSRFVDETRFVEKYWSPEKGPGKVIDYRSDIYEFGCVLLDFLPFIEQNDRTREMLFKVCKKCTKKQPSERYQSVDEILDILVNMLMID